MKIQDALDTIDEMISNLEIAHSNEYDQSIELCRNRSFYEAMDARHQAELEKYQVLRDAIERGLDYQV